MPSSPKEYNYKPLYPLIVRNDTLLNERDTRSVVVVCTCVDVLIGRSKKGVQQNFLLAPLRKTLEQLINSYLSLLQSILSNNAMV